MMKRLVPVIILLFISAHNFAQTRPADSSTHFIAAFNAEQMLEKMGFDNLMKTLFENKQFDKKNTPEAVAQKTSIRKALAALYGAGFNLNKKIWLQVKETESHNPFTFGTMHYSAPMRLVIISVANKQVVQDNILKLIAAEEKTDTVQFINSYGVSWMQNKKSVILISNTEMMVAALPQKESGYNHPLYYYGNTIKSDTVVTPKTKTWADDETVEITEKPVVIEIDKLQPDGKIKRVYTYKDPLKNIKGFTPPKIVKDEEIKVDSAVAVMDTAAVAIDPVPSFSDAASDTITVKQDTLSRGEYLNDSTYITHYYIPFTDAQKDSLQVIYQLEKDIEMQKQALEFVQHYQTYLPKEENAVINKLSTDTADIVFYSATGGASPYSFFGSRMLGSGPARLLNNQAATVTAINFTNGQVTMTSTYINSNNTATNLFAQLYKPITNFWPAALGTPALGNMQFNINIPQLLTSIKNAGTSDKLEREIKREGIDLDELQKAFTGQVSAAIHPGVNKYGKKQPRLLIALQVNDAASAVGFMNRIGSKKTKSVNNYRFDENAKYLLFDTDGKNGLLKQAVTPVQKMPATAAGTVASLNLNIKAMMLAFTKDSKKNNAEYKQAQQFFNTMNVTAATSATGNFTTVFTADMGNPKTNALYNLLQMINGRSNGGGLPNLLKGIR